MDGVDKILRALLLCFAVVSLAACTGNTALNRSQEANGAFVETGGQQQQGIGGSAAVSAQKVFSDNQLPSPGSSNAGDYKIAPLDVMDVTVLGLPDLSRTVQVSSSGMITLPLIKSVRAGGRTAGQLEADISKKLQASYLQSPQVSVFVKEFNSQKITVDGAVVKPGIFPITGQVSLLQAIALAQGLNPVADTSGILLFRTVNNKRLAARFDLKQIRAGKVQDPKLEAGDIVMVDESATRTTLRDVKDALPLSGLFQLLLL